MAKSTEEENRDGCLATKDFTEVPSNAEFLRSLNQKQAAALFLSEELAAWFGDHSKPSSFTPAFDPQVMMGVRRLPQSLR